MFFPYFTPKLFCFLYIQLLVCTREISTYLLLEVFFCYFGISWFFLYCLTLSRYLLSFSSFANIFRFISSSWIVKFDNSFVLVFSSQHILVYFFFLSNFACCHNFFTCPSSLISHPGFVFLLGTLGEHRFSRWLISLQPKLGRLV